MGGEIEHVNTTRTASSFIVFEHKILLLLRDDIPTISDPNHWSTMGGYVEEGETDEEGVRREVREESGIELEEIYYIGSRVKASGQMGSYYFAHLNPHQLTQITLGDEGQELRFFEFDELANLELAGTFRKFYSEYPEVIERMLSEEEPPTARSLGLQG